MAKHTLTELNQMSHEELDLNLKEFSEEILNSGKKKCVGNHFRPQIIAILMGLSTCHLLQ